MAASQSFLAFLLLLAAASSASATRQPGFSFGSEAEGGRRALLKHTYTHAEIEKALAKCRKLRKLFNNECSALKKHAAFCKKTFGTVKCTKAGGAAGCSKGQVLTKGVDGKNHCKSGGSQTAQTTETPTTHKARKGEQPTAQRRASTSPHSHSAQRPHARPTPGRAQPHAAPHRAAAPHRGPTPGPVQARTVSPVAPTATPVVTPTATPVASTAPTPTPTPLVVSNTAVVTPTPVPVTSKPAPPPPDTLQPCLVPCGSTCCMGTDVCVSNSLSSMPPVCMPPLSPSPPPSTGSVQLRDAVVTGTNSPPPPYAGDTIYLSG